ncbi:MAG: alpha/beta hydrolase [Caldilineaceae bacterium]|nr:alpha/beta hydrolase [Caldilineaceae bacterium]
MNSFLKLIDRFMWPTVIALGLMAAPQLAHLASAQSGEFEQVDCIEGFGLNLGETEGIVCGYVAVPLRHARPSADDGQTVRVAVVILESWSDAPEPDPLFMAQGGPGGSTIDGFLDLMLSHPLRADRDIVLIDQRGAYYSQPNLVCTELLEAMPGLLPLSSEEARPLLAEAVRDCRQSLGAAGVELAAFNSLESAADLDLVRAALDYETFNYYGVSYGTLLGLHLMRNHPEHLRSVILDGVVPPQADFILDVPQNIERVFSELFQTCQESPACAEGYPNLEQEFFALVERLDEQPAFFEIIDPDNGENAQVRFGGDELIDFSFQIFYLDGGAEILPRLFVDMAEGDFTFAQTILPFLVFDRTWSDGLYQSVVCSEEVDSFSLRPALEGVRPRFARDAQVELGEYADNCRIWEVAALSAEVDEAVVSDVPALLLSGRFDPITPPANADRVAQTLANSYTFTDPLGGHGVALNANPCVDGLVADFLAQPMRAPASDCLADDPSPNFAPADAVKISFLGELSRLSDFAQFQIVMAGLFLLGLFSALVVWPLGYLVRLAQEKPLQLTPTHRRLRRLSQLLVLLFVGLMMLFAVGIVAVTVYVAFNDEMLLLLSALPGWSAPLFLIPPLLAALAVAIVVAAVQGWRVQLGSLPGRLYYSLLAICAVGYIVILATSGMLLAAF